MRMEQEDEVKKLNEVREASMTGHQGTVSRPHTHCAPIPLPPWSSVDSRCPVPRGTGCPDPGEEADSGGAAGGREASGRYDGAGPQAGPGGPVADRRDPKATDDPVRAC